MNHIKLILLIGLLSFSCHSTQQEEARNLEETGDHIVIKKRDDGTTSSVNQVDDQNKIHGVRITYYEDGKTVYSRTTFTHGIKNGPFIHYYRNGQVFEHTSYTDGKKDGLTRIYHMNGQLAAEFEYDHGIVLPGLREYERDGTPVKSYPEIRFTEEDHLDTHQRIDLIISCTQRGINVKYYLLEKPGAILDRVYLISEKGSAILHYYLKPGETIEKNIHIIAEIPTALGNVYVRALTYNLKAKN